MQSSERSVVIFRCHAISAPVWRRCVMHPAVLRGVHAAWLPFLWRERRQVLILTGVQLFTSIAEQKPEGINSDPSSHRKNRGRDQPGNDSRDLFPSPALAQRSTSIDC